MIKTPYKTLSNVSRETKKPRKKPVFKEHPVQVALCDYLNLLGAKFHSTPNEGKRSAFFGYLLKKQGLKPEFPDLTIDMARHHYHGMHLEVKAPGKKPTPGQLKCHEELREEGYYVQWCDSVEQGISFINYYFGIYEGCGIIPKKTKD